MKRHRGIDNRSKDNAYFGSAFFAPYDLHFKFSIHLCTATLATAGFCAPVFLRPSINLGVLFVFALVRFALLAFPAFIFFRFKIIVTFLCLRKFLFSWILIFVRWFFLFLSLRIHRKLRFSGFFECVDDCTSSSEESCFSRRLVEVCWRVSSSPIAAIMVLAIYIWCN